MHVTLKPTLKVQTKLLSYSSSDVLPCYAPSIFARAPALIDGISTAIIHDELVPRLNKANHHRSLARLFAEILLIRIQRL